MNSGERAREMLIHQSANRPNLILGGDRELVLLTIMIAVALGFSLASWWGVGLAAGFWIMSVAALQRMGKADPLLRHVYLRHIRYTSYYPAKGRLDGRSAETPANWR
jgi:type IV secretion system protein TrbD